MEVSKYKLDNKKTDDGVWVPIEHDKDGNVLAQLLIARANNTKFQEYLRILSKPHTRQIQAGIVDDNLLVDLVRKATAKHILLGWEGLTQNGKKLNYSQSVAEELLKMDYFSELVDAASKDMALFLESSAKEDADALKKP